MNFRGPRPADFKNVQVLNTAFVGLLLCGGQRAMTLRGPLPEALQRRFSSLTLLQRERLARTPFLLVSFREADSQYWEELLDAGPTGCLFEKATSPDRAETELLGAALGFIWQLARDNAYAARLVCGASLHWCEQLADRPLLQVVSAAARSNVMQLRRAHDARFWQKLLHAGVAGEATIRRAARIGALQQMLTASPEAATVQTARAARLLRRPSLKVAESNEH